MTPRALLNLLDYHYWARDRLLDAAEQLTDDQLHQELGNSFGSVCGTLEHLVSAEAAWCSRWEGEPPGAHLALPDFDTVQDVRARWSLEEARVREFVDRLGSDGMDRVIRYTQRSGVPVEAVFWHTLQHVVNHATFHRGQVTTMLRQLGAQPPKSQDLIAFYTRSGA